MKWLKRIALSIVTLLALAILGIGGIYVWLSSGALDVPDLGEPTHAEAEIYNNDFLPAITASRDVLVTARERLEAPAISIAVSVNGELVWAEAQGFADIETREPVTLNSRFTIGSVSKTLTATAAAIMWEDGVLDLDADIHTYVPDYPELPFPLTTRHLLSHQGGIRHYGFAMTPPIFTESGLNIQFDTTAEALSLFENDPLLFEPDTDFSYSTYGYTLASAVMEGAAGERFLDILQQRIFDSVGMTNTSADFSDRPVPNRVADYVSLRFMDGLLPAPETNSSYKWAGGGLVSTPTDLVRFGNALLLGDLVSEGTREVMFTPRTTADGEINPQHYGLGWRMGGMYYPQGSENIITMINHGGTSVGGTAIILLYPDSGLVIAMTANVTPPGGSGPLRSEGATVANIFLDHMGFAP